MRDFGEWIKGASAIVYSSTADACFFVYSSVGDNRAGDSVFIPAVRHP